MNEGSSAAGSTDRGSAAKVGDEADRPGAGGERAPGEAVGSPMRRVVNYLIGLALAATLTGISFWVCGSDVFWAPGVPAGLCVLAVAQMGIHLVFFLHINTGQDSVNNVLAVAFGILIVVLLGAGTLWIMSNLNDRMAPMDGGMSAPGRAEGEIRSPTHEGSRVQVQVQRQVQVQVQVPMQGQC